MQNKNINIPLLTSEDIEVKIKQITKNGALALLYKTARVDRRILNDVFGPLNWTSDYKVVKDNLYCGIGIREDISQPFVWKWDCGIESRSDNDGNEKKGAASDAFKRAGYAVGIGEELYSSPFIWLSVATKEDPKKGWVLSDPMAKYVVTDIKYNEKTRVITELHIANAKTNVEVFGWVLPTTGAIAQKMDKTVETKSVKEPVKAAKKAVTDTKVADTTNTPATEKIPFKDLITKIAEIVKKMKSTDNDISVYHQVVVEVTGKQDFKCNAATEADYDLCNSIYNKLVAKGY